MVESPVTEDGEFQYADSMDKQAAATPEEALAWVRRMMLVYNPDTAREIVQQTRDHEQIIMGGWDRRQRKNFPGLLVTLNEIQRKQTFMFAILGLVVLGTSVPTWWPFIRSLWP